MAKNKYANATAALLAREADNLNQSAYIQGVKINTARNDGKGRDMYNAMLSSMEIEAAAASLMVQISEYNGGNTPLVQFSNMVTIHALKTAARGRVIKGKDGKPKKDDSGNVKTTPVNLMALKVLQMGIYDDSGVLDDLRQSVTLAILEAINSGAAVLDSKLEKHEHGANTDKLKMIPCLFITDLENDGGAVMRSIYNVVQNYLNAHLQRHYKRQYAPVIDENGNESFEMITAAMREYAKSLDGIEKNELFQSLTAVLNEVESAVLWTKCEKKQVERAYSDHGTSKKHYVSRFKTLAEISEETGYSIQTVRTALKNIQAKFTEVLADNGKATRARTNGGAVDSLKWTETTSADGSAVDTDTIAAAIASRCSGCVAQCGGGDNTQPCAYAAYWLM